MSDLLHGCVRYAGVPDWCTTHGAFFIADRPYCWATIRPNGDPLHVPEEPAVRPTIDNRGMVVVWVIAALGIALILILTAIIVALRTPGG